MISKQQYVYRERHSPVEVGFTLIETLVAMGIFIMLVMIATLNLSSLRDKARVSRALNFDSSIYSTRVSELIGHWKFDETAGTTVIDSSSREYNGTFVNTPLRLSGTNCILGGCLRFDGSTDAVNIGIQSFDVGTSDFTISFWINLEDYTAPDYEYIMRTQYNPGVAGISIFFDPNFGGRGIMMQVNDTDGDLQVLDLNMKPKLLKPFAWHHVAFSMKRTPGTSNITGYLDGTKTGSLTLNANMDKSFSDETTTNYIGMLSGSVIGSIDEIRLYKGALE